MAATEAIPVEKDVFYGMGERHGDGMTAFKTA
jgi:hypothetical protein